MVYFENLNATKTSVSFVVATSTLAMGVSYPGAGF